MVYNYENFKDIDTLVFKGGSEDDCEDTGSGYLEMLNTPPEVPPESIKQRDAFLITYKNDSLAFILISFSHNNYWAYKMGTFENKSAFFPAQKWIDFSDFNDDKIDDEVKAELVWILDLIK